VKIRLQLLYETVLLGIVGALSAQAFMFMLRTSESFFLIGIAGYRAPKLPAEGGPLGQIVGPHWLWLIPLATTLGGLISGILVYDLAPEAEGHGTDSVVKAFHHAGGYIRARVAPLKMIASAITIGSGGAAGREGPIALITAGVGSVYATYKKRDDEERRLLVLIGMASGLAAIFRSPVGTAIFAIEVLYSDMEFDASTLLYTMLGSVIAYALNGVFVGFQPMFLVPPSVSAPPLSAYPLYVALGVAAGLVAAILPPFFYGVRDIFRALRMPDYVKPAVGGLAIGLLALFLPQVLGGGYGWIQEAIDGHLALGLMAALMFAKMLAFCFTVSSGGSGGIFAPTLFVGAMLGGIVARVFNQPPAAFTVVGMAAVLGGAARVPLATLLMVTEMTGGYQLLVPATLAMTLSYILQLMMSGPVRYKSLYEAQVPGRIDSPAHQAEHLEAAIKMVCERRIPFPGKIGHLDLRAFVSSGLPIDLPGGKQMILGVLRPESPCVGRPLRTVCSEFGYNEAEIVAVFRQDETFLYHSDVLLVPGDQMLIIASLQAWRNLADNFSPA
jgi:CIC family chloride channel protein